MMDKKNIKILEELEKNARISISKIAKKLNISRQAAIERFRKLEKEIIEGYYTIINYVILGYSLYVVYLKFSKISSKIKQRLIERINKINNVGLNVSTLGKWDLNIAIWAKSSFEFENIMRKILEKHSEYISDVTIMIETSARYFNLILFNKNITTRDIIAIDPSHEVIELDRKNIELLRMLASNARISLIDLASKLKITPVAVIKRIKELENKGVILRYKPQINLNKFNLLHLKIFLKIKNFNKEREKELTKILSLIPNVISVSKTYGYYDLEFRLFVKNILEIEDIIGRIEKNFSGEIKSYDLIFFTKFHKVLNFFPQ